MKLNFYKRALALALCMSLCSTTAFAKENVALSAEEQGVKAAVTVDTTETEVALPVLTLEDAIKKVKKQNATLRGLQDTADMLQENKEDLWDSVGYFSPITNYDYKKWVNDAWYVVNSSMFTIASSMEQTKYGLEVAEYGAEFVTKSCFTSILNVQENLKLVQKNAELQEILYQQGKVKNEIGLLSNYNLESLRVAAESAKASEESLLNSLEQLYITMNNLMGEKTDARFTYVYDIEYAPYEMSRPMEQYIADKTKNDPSIKMLELNVELAKFNQNYRAESDTGSSDATLEYNLNDANRTLKNTKTSMEKNLKNTYLQIQQKESDYASALTDLEKAKLDYRTAQVNYQAGNATTITAQQAELGVLQAEIVLQGLIYEHDLLIYQFEHPSMIGDSIS